MSTSANTWFYSNPEPKPYMITERVNGTFWQARVAHIYWHCVRAEAPFRVEGYTADATIQMEWVPGKWLALRIPEGIDPASLVETVSRHILSMPAALTYIDTEGRRVYEWHTDGGRARWKEVQGRAGFVKPRRLVA